MTFPEALNKVIALMKIRRLEWPGNEYILLKDGFLMLYKEGSFHRLWVTDGDLLGKDWVTC